MPSHAYDFDHRGYLVEKKQPGFRRNQCRAAAAACRQRRRRPPPRRDRRPPISSLDRSRDDLLTDFGKATLRDRYLLAGESFQDMFARVSCAYADDVDHAQRLYDAMSQLWFMPATPVLSNGGTDARPADLLLSQRGAGFAGRHRRDLERECLARLQRRRHRHLLGPGPLDRREGEGRRDLRHHPLHPCDGRADAGDQPGLAAARLGGGLSRHPSSGDRGIPRNPQGRPATSTARASTCITASTSPTSSWKRCATNAMFALRSPKNNEVMREVECAATLAAHSRNPPADRRALSPVHRHGEPRAAEASARAGPEGLDLEPVQRDHAADRHRPSRRGAHRGVLPVLAQPRDLGPVVRRAGLHRRRACACSTTC